MHFECSGADISGRTSCCPAITPGSPIKHHRSLSGGSCHPGAAVATHSHEQARSRRRHAAGARQRVGQGQVSAPSIAAAACGRPWQAAVEQRRPASARGPPLLAPDPPCRQHGALGFSGIPRTEAEELAKEVAALQAKVRRRRRQGLLLALHSRLFN